MIPISKPLIGRTEKLLVQEVLESGMLAQGTKTKEFEKKFSDLCGVKNSVAVNSGTAAIHTALYAAGIKKGDEVITVPFTFVATANPIIMQRAKPVFVDVKENTFNIDPKLIREKINSKTKAIIAVDLYGQIFDYDAVAEIAEDHNLVLIEDACQSINASIRGKKAGSFGDIATFSLYATKNITSGEGGVLTTNNEKFAELASRFRNHGQSEHVKYEYLDIGYNYRMTDIQAAIALGQIENLNKFTEQRIKNAKRLTEGLKDTPGIKVPFVKANSAHVFHQYTIKVDGFKLTRDELASCLIKNGTGCGIYYPKPLHVYPHFAKYGYKKGDFPVAEKLCDQVLSLPVHPALSESDIVKIIEVIKNA